MEKDIGMTCRKLKVPMNYDTEQWEAQYTLRTRVLRSKYKGNKLVDKNQAIRYAKKQSKYIASNRDEILQNCQKCN